MRKRKKRLWLLILSATLMMTSAPAQAEEPMEADRTLSPYFYVESQDTSTDRFPLKGTKVSTNINGIIADTFVTQTYQNQGDKPINASYVFPASTKVTVHGMKMEIGDQVVTAKIKEREEAKEEFEEAKQEGKSASLLEEQRPNVFTMNVANIMPGDEVHIELHYTELITSTDGTYQFVYPTVVGPRYVSPSQEETAQVEPWEATPYLREGITPPGTYDIDVSISASVPITSLNCSSHKVKINRESSTAAQLQLLNSEDFAGNRDYILEYKLTGEEISSGLMLGTGEKENFFMMMVQPPERFQAEDILPREYIFVLDVSGSMYGYPLDTAKELIRNLVGNLSETDRFNLILFSGTSFQMSPQSVPATKDNIRQAIDIIDHEDGGGGTELAPALEDAIAIPRAETMARSIVVLTDGYIYGEEEIFDLIRKNLNTTNFFSFGIGDSVNRFLIEGIAKTGLGEAFVVTDPKESSSTAENFKTYIESPLLTDIQVSYEGFDVYDVEPDKLPTLFAKRPIVLFGKWRGEPSGTIRITGKQGNQDYSREISVSEASPSQANNAIGYLWARTKVDRLTDYGFSQEDNEKAKKEITDIGLNYSMITPYTSFIAVLETVRNPDGESTDVDQPLPLPLHVSDLAVGGGYASGSEPGLIMILAVTAALLLLSYGYRTRKKRLMAGKGN